MSRANSILAPLLLSIAAFAVLLRLRKESYYSPDGIRVLTRDDNDE